MPLIGIVHCSGSESEIIFNLMVTGCVRNKITIMDLQPIEQLYLASLQYYSRKLDKITV